MIDKNAYALATEDTASADDFLARIRALNREILRLLLMKAWSIFVGGDVKYRREYQAQIAVLRSELMRYQLAWTYVFWKNRGRAA